MSEHHHKTKTIITGLTQDNIKEKMELHYREVEKIIKFFNVSELKVITTVDYLSTKEAKVYTSFEGK